MRNGRINWKKQAQSKIADCDTAREHWLTNHDGIVGYDINMYQNSNVFHHFFCLFVVARFFARWKIYNLIDLRRYLLNFLACVSHINISDLFFPIFQLQLKPHVINTKVQSILSTWCFNVMEKSTEKSKKSSRTKTTAHSFNLLECILFSSFWHACVVLFHITYLF